MQKHWLWNLRKLTLYVSFLVLNNCSQHKTVTLDFNFFSVQTPIGWKKISLRGFDSTTFGIQTVNGDTLFIDYGLYSNSFSNVIEVRSLKTKKMYDSLHIEYPQNMIFSIDYEIDQAQSIYLKEYYYYDVIDGKKAKVGFPKVSKKGLCLIYFPKVDSVGNKLSIYAKNVDDATKEEIYSFFKSIKFKK